MLNCVCIFQPRRLKKSNDNNEEIRAFGQLQSILISLLSQGQIAIVKLKLRKILSLWHDGNKVRLLQSCLLVTLTFSLFAELKGAEVLDGREVVD
jgi:hypothetical protein